MKKAILFCDYNSQFNIEKQVEGREFMFKKKLIAGLLAVVMVLSMTACGGSNKQSAKTSTDTAQGTSDDQKTDDAASSTSTYDTLVIGTQAFNAVWNSFFVSSGYDTQVCDMIFAPFSLLDKDGVLVDNLGNISAEEIKAQDGHTQVLYTLKMKEGLKFSDGSPMTIDDLIFTYYVYADPSYDGSSTFNTQDIVGLKDYYYDTKDYKKIVKDIQDKYSPDKISYEDFLEYAKATNLAGWFTGDISGDIGDGRTWTEYLHTEGVFTEDEAKKIDTPEKMIEALAKVEYEKYKSGYDATSYFTKKVTQANIADGVDIEEISGIKKVDDLTCTVLYDAVDILGDRNLTWIRVMPKAHYGKDFKKGDVAPIKALNDKPMGAGPYIFESYENNIVSLKANPNYFLGQPKIPNLKFQVVSEEDKVNAVLNGDIDVTDPSASLEIVDQIKASADKAAYTLVDNAGYGYIGINAKKVPDINVRKGLMHLMNRKPAVSSYYGELAQVIERPMVPTLPEYPKDAKEYYGYDTAKAKEYFLKAGYTEKDGKLVDKNGKQLVINAGIGDAKSHPSTPILTQMKNDLVAMGADLVVNDLQFSVLSDKVQAGEIDMWVMAWGNSKDCDLTQIFSSKGGTNYQQYHNDELDKLIEKVRITIDLEERKKLVAKELDMIMDAAVYMPIYQRKNMEIYNATTIKLDTLPEETTSYWNYVSQIEKLEMN